MSEAGWGVLGDLEQVNHFWPHVPGKEVDWTTYFYIKQQLGTAPNSKNHNSFKKDILEHFKNMDASQGSKKCIYNWVGGPAITINLSTTFFQWNMN